MKLDRGISEEYFREMVEAVLAGINSESPTIFASYPKELVELFASAVESTLYIIEQASDINEAIAGITALKIYALSKMDGPDETPNP